MFGAIDAISAMIMDIMAKEEKPSFKKIKISYKNSNNLWICLFPPFVHSNFLIRNKFIPKNSNAVVYNLSDVPVVPEISKTKKFLDKVYNDALLEAKKAIHSGKKVGIICVSIANVIGYRLANKIKTNKLISVVPGANLAECIWESYATRRQVLDSIKLGYTFKDFEKILEKYAPEKNLSNLPKNLQVYLGRWDRYIPFDQGMELISELKKRRKTPIVNINNIFGHLGTILLYKNNLS